MMGDFFSYTAGTKREANVNVDFLDASKDKSGDFFENQFAIDSPSIKTVSLFMVICLKVSTIPLGQ